MGLPPDFELVDDIAVKIAAKEEKHGSASLSDEQRIVSTIWMVYGIVGNGAIQYLLEHIAIDIEQAARCYEAVDMPESAELLRKAIAKFPNGKRPADFQKFLAYIERHEDFFDELSNEFWETQEDKVEKVLAGYIKQHPDAFKEFRK
jgi:hypothetical protein